jgi:restriction system protein
MARRGFFAEMQHQAKVAARKKEQAQRAAVREHNAAVRRAEQAHKQAERARVQAARASEAERKRADAEARRLHIEAMTADASERNSALEQTYAEIDSLLEATLNVDDFVDLESLRQIPEHPPFDRLDLENPVPPPPPVPVPPEPTFEPPPAATGLGSLFGKKKQAEAMAKAQTDHQSAVAAWRAEMAQIPAREQERNRAHQEAERKRLTELAAQRSRYQDECAGRDRAVAESNRALDELITGLGYGTADAVEEYISIVLSNSVYPEFFQVEHQFHYAAQEAELSLRVRIPSPSDIPSTKAFKYTKASDEITSTELPQKQRRDRYAGAVHHVALRTLHEVFEADRRGIIRSISLEVGTRAIDPATGQPIDVVFVAVATDRAKFMSIDLGSVVPLATLQHLGAAVSKNPFDLVAIDPSGVRRA